MSQNPQNGAVKPDRVNSQSTDETSADTSRNYSSVSETSKDKEVAIQSNILPHLSPVESAKSIKNFFWADPSRFHGKGYGNSKFIRDAEITANIVNSSNTLDFITNYPLLLFLFSDISGPFKFIVALLFNLFILKFTKECAAGSSSYHRNNRSWSASASLGFIGLSIIQSLSSGVSVELTLNQSGLINLKASEIIDAKTSQVRKSAEELRTQKLSTTTHKKDRSNCNKYKSKIENLQENNKATSLDAEFNQAYIDAYGERANEKNFKSNNYPIDDLPVCRRVERREQTAEIKYYQYIADWEDILTSRGDMGDVKFVRTQLPDLYTESFLEDNVKSGNSFVVETKVRSGVELARLAFKNFFNKLDKGDFSGLGLSLFIFSISAVTSLTTCIVTISYASRKDVQNSWEKDHNSLFDDFDGFNNFWPKFFMTAISKPMNIFNGNGTMDVKQDSNNIDKSQNVKAGRDVSPVQSVIGNENKDTNIVGNFAQEAINKLNENPELKKNLELLCQNIDRATNELSAGEKTTLLEQTKSIAEASTKPEPEKSRLLNRAKENFTFVLKHLPEAAKIIDSGDKLLPVIFKLLGLP